MIKINLTEKEVLRIAQDFNDKYELHGELTGEVRFYERFSKNVKGLAAWLVIGLLDIESSEYIDKQYEIVISDETALVEYVIDTNQFERYPHIEEYHLSEEEIREILEDDLD